MDRKRWGRNMVGKTERLRNKGENQNGSLDSQKDEHFSSTRLANTVFLRYGSNWHSHIWVVRGHTIAYGDEICQYLSKVKCTHPLDKPFPGHKPYNRVPSHATPKRHQNCEYFYISGKGFMITTGQITHNITYLSNQLCYNKYDVQVDRDHICYNPSGD